MAATHQPTSPKTPCGKPFAAYADTHEAASIRRCWSTWNTLCSFLFTADLLAANPMPPHGRTNRQNGPAAAATAPTRRPSLAHTLPGKPRQGGHRPLMPAVALVEALTDPDLPNELARFIGNRIDVVAQVP